MVAGKVAFGALEVLFDDQHGRLWSYVRRTYRDCAITGLHRGVLSVAEGDKFATILMDRR